MPSLGCNYDITLIIYASKTFWLQFVLNLPVMQYYLHIFQTMKTKGKGKSSHDLLDDEKLSTIPAVDQTFDPPKKSKKKRKKSNEVVQI